MSAIATPRRGGRGAVRPARRTLAAAVLLGFCAAGCGGGVAAPAATPSASSTATATAASCGATAPPPRIPAGATHYPLTFRDDAGRTVTIPHEPTRIVSLTLGTDEILFSLVPRSRIVGVTDLAAQPASSFVTAAAKGLPGLTANAAAVVALHPDLVFAASYTQPGVVAQLTAAGIPVVEFTTFCSLSNVEQHVRTMGWLLDEPAAAAAVTAQMNAEVARVEHAVAGAPRPTVVFYSGGYLFGSGTTINQVIRDAGGVNAAAAAGFSGWTQVGLGEIVKLNPDVILTDGASADDADQGGAARTLLQDPALRAVRAVRDHRVWELSPRADSDVSQYMAYDVQDVAALLHPGRIAPYHPPA